MVYKYEFKCSYIPKHEDPKKGKYFVEKNMKQLMKQNPGLDFSGATRCYIRELRIVIPK